MYFTPSPLRPVRMTVRPSYWRCCFTYVLPWLIGILATAVFDPYTSALPMSFPVWVGGKIAGFAGTASVVLLITPWIQDHLSIPLDDEFVSRPDGVRGRVEFPLDKLARERTCRQTVLQRLFGYRHL
jgi:hypothetical protein